MKERQHRQHTYHDITICAYNLTTIQSCWLLFTSTQDVGPPARIADNLNYMQDCHQIRSHLLLPKALLIYKASQTIYSCYVNFAEPMVCKNNHFLKTLIMIKLSRTIQIYITRGKIRLASPLLLPILHRASLKKYAQVEYKIMFA